MEWLSGHTDVRDPRNSTADYLQGFDGGMRRLLVLQSSTWAQVWRLGSTKTQKKEIRNPLSDPGRR